jgi:hypothetical protein
MELVPAYVGVVFSLFILDCMVMYSYYYYFVYSVIALFYSFSLPYARLVVRTWRDYTPLIRFIYFGVWQVLTINSGFLSGRYVDKLFMACGYEAEQQLLPLIFAVVAGEKSVANWGWFMQWVRKEVVGPSKITVISYQHLGIRTIFDKPDFGWQKSTCEAYDVIRGELMMLYH